MGPILSPMEKDQCGSNGTNCVSEMESLDHFNISSNFRQTLKSSKGERFILRSTVDVVHGWSMRMLHISVDNSKGDGSSNEEQSKKMSTQEHKVVSFPIGRNWCNYTGFYIPATSRLGVVMGGSLILWTLSATRPCVCTLTLIWRFQEMYKDLETNDVCTRKIISVGSCVNGRHIKLQLTAPSWYRNTSDITKKVAEWYGEEGQGTLTIPISNDDTFYTTEERNSGRRDFRVSQERRMSQGIADLLEVYLGCNDQCQHAIIQYLKSHIRPSDENRISSLISLCKAWKPHLRKQIELLLEILLPPNCITWVPINHPARDTGQLTFIQETNPLAVILETSRKQFSALGAARIIMEYCVGHANRSRNLSSLSPFFSCLHDIMELYPDEAFRYLSRIALIPVMNRSYLLDNSIVVLPPSFRWKFWMSKVPLYKLRHHVFQLHVSSSKPDPENEKFTNPVFMASFDALWRRRHDHEGTHQESKRNGSMIRKTTWSKALYHMIMHQLRFRSHSFVMTYNFSIEFYDHPAIAALVAYKWYDCLAHAHCSLAAFRSLSLSFSTMVPNVVVLLVYI